MSAGADAGPLVRLVGVDLARGGRTVVHGVDLEVAPGEVVALVGGDGAGKSTTLMAVTGRLDPVRGTARVPARGTAGVVPAVGATWPDLTVTENLDVARSAHGAAGADDAFAEQLLRRMGIADARHRLAGNLSGGMRQKLALAMAMQHRPALLVLDEPTTGVDPVSRAEIWRLLSEEVAGGTAVVMATTYLDEAARATRVVVLDGGHVLEQGAPDDVVARTPGAVVVADEPLAATSWRRGRRWQTWLADGAPDPLPVGAALVTPDLEDCAIVAALRAQAQAVAA